ncbi:unnamed protein product [Musa hybrid cultivar]
MEPSSGFFCDDIAWWSCHDRGLRRPQHDRDRRWVQVGMLTSAVIDSQAYLTESYVSIVGVFGAAEISCSVTRAMNRIRLCVLCV